VDHREADETSGIESPVSTIQGSTTSPGLSSGSGGGGTSPQPSGSQNQSAVPQPVVTFISLTVACKLVVSSLRKEKGKIKIENKIRHSADLLCSMTAIHYERYRLGSVGIDFETNSACDGEQGPDFIEAWE